MNNTQRRNCPSVRTVMFPHDTNGSGRIFGGVILSHIDIAGVVACRKVCSHRFVTVFFKSVEFKKPVFVNDVLTCWAEVTKIGRTSISTHIWVEVERDGQYIPVTEGEAIYVAVDNDDKPLQVADALTPFGKALLRKQHRAEAAAARTGTTSGNNQPGSQGSATNKSPVDPSSSNGATASGDMSGVDPRKKSGKRTRKGKRSCGC